MAAPSAPLAKPKAMIPGIRRCVYNSSAQPKQKPAERFKEDIELKRHEEQLRSERLAREASAREEGAWLAALMQRQRQEDGSGELDYQEFIAQFGSLFSGPTGRWLLITLAFVC